MALLWSPSEKCSVKTDSTSSAARRICKEFLSIKHSKRERERERLRIEITRMYFPNGSRLITKVAQVYLVGGDEVGSLHHLHVTRRCVLL